MRKSKILFNVLLVGIMSLLLIACSGGGDGSDETIDSTRTQLYVSNYNGGFGDQWLKNLKERFEELYKDEVYEDGKKGVQIMLQNNKDNGISNIDKVSGSSSEVFFNEYVYYYDYLERDLLLDITDVVKADLADMGDTGTIEEKMTKEQRDFYQSDGKYYGIPHYAGYSGIIYDVDLFESQKLYFKDTGKDGGSEFIVNKSDVRSAGPDGVLSTYDDGLPATYEEFFLLCEKMYINGITPFVWTGQHNNDYLENMMHALVVDHEGLDQAMLRYSFSGEATGIIGDVNNGQYQKKAAFDITHSNAYETLSSEGVFNALSFVHKIVTTSKYYTDLSFSPSHLHLDAQKDFLDSDVVKNKPIGMLIEGVWWEEEAKDQFRYLSDRYGSEYGRYERKFALMPMPKTSKENLGGTTLFDSHNSLGFIRKSIDEYKIPLAKEFLRFANTEESLIEFNVTTGTVKALDYTLSDNDKAKLSYFGASLYDMHKRSDIVYPYSTDSMYIENQSFFGHHELYKSKIGTQEYTRPIEYFRTNGSSAEAYFNGISNYYESIWESKFNRYFND